MVQVWSTISSTTLCCIGRNGTSPKKSWRGPYPDRGSGDERHAWKAPDGAITRSPCEPWFSKCPSHETRLEKTKKNNLEEDYSYTANNAHVKPSKGNFFVLRNKNKPSPNLQKKRLPQTNLNVKVSRSRDERMITKLRFVLGWITPEFCLSDCTWLIACHSISSPGFIFTCLYFYFYLSFVLLSETFLRSVLRSSFVFRKCHRTPDKNYIYFGYNRDSTIAGWNIIRTATRLLLIARERW